MSELLPHSPLTEKVILAAIINDLAAFWRIRPIISQRSFFLPEHIQIFEAIETIAFEGEPLGLDAVRTEILRTRGVVEGDVRTCLITLADGLPDGADVMDDVRILYEYELKRSLFSIIADATMLLEEQSDPTPAIRFLRSELDRVEREYAFSVCRALRDRTKSEGAEIIHSTELAVGP